MAHFLAFTGVAPATERVELQAENIAVAAAFSGTPAPGATPPQADGTAIASPLLDVARYNTDKNKNMRKEPATHRAHNWSLGKCVGLVLAGT